MCSTLPAGLSKFIDFAKDVITTETFNTPRYGRLQIIQRILRLEGHNSVINASNSAGQTPLHISSFSGK